MRLEHLFVVAFASLGALSMGVPARAEPGSVLVPLDHRFGWNAYPPSWMSPSYRTCRQVSTPSPGWVCRFSQPPFIEKPYYREGQAVRAKPAKKQALKVKQGKKSAYAAKPKSGKESAKVVKRRDGPG